MHLAMRSTLTAGIALAGAGAIAVSPISPVSSATSGDMVAESHVTSASVELTAFADPLENPFATDPLMAWQQVFGTATEHLGQIGEEIAANPFPVLQQVIANQIGYGQLFATSVDAAAMSYIRFFTSAEDYQGQFFASMARDYLAAGNVAGAASVVSNVVFRLFAFANPLINTMQIPLGMGRNLMNALSTVPELLMPLGLGVLNPVEGVINVLGDSTQNVLDAVEAGDPSAALNALVNTPAVLAGAILTGYSNGIAAGTTGLISAADAVFNRGLVESLVVTVPQAIATAIGWQKPTDVTTPDNAELPTASPVVQSETPPAARVLSHPGAGLTDTAGRVAESTTAAVNSIKTVTLSVAPQLKVARDRLTGTSAEVNSAGSGSEKPVGTDTEQTTEADPKAAKKPTRTAKRDLKAQRHIAEKDNRKARQGTRTPSHGGKHRAGGGHAD